MTRQEQIEEMAKIVDEMYNVYTTTAEDIAKGIYNAGYRKVDEIKRLEKENEQLKAKLEKNPLAIKQKIMEEDDYELTEREQATLFLDRMESDVEILNDIVENLDELLGKGIDEYIKGIDGVEGLKDMWERSAVREFAEKIKEKYSLYDDRHILYRIIDELLKEYE